MKLRKKAVRRCYENDHMYGKRMYAKLWGLTETQQDEVMQEYNGNRKLRGEIPNDGSRCISNWDIKIV